MYHFDFCFAWSWPYDADFAAILRSVCQQNQLSLGEITPENINTALQAVENGELRFSALFDRASDADVGFLPLAEWALQQNLIYLNRYWLARRAWDKATMHQQFTRSGLDAPYTIALPSYRENPTIPMLDLGLLGDQFAIKPAHGGGGKGVITGANSWEQIYQARQAYPDDQLLLQAQVEPYILGGRPAWFRMIYCLEQIFVCWWDPKSHFYSPISDVDIDSYGLSTLFEIPSKIARISHLELFSTEVALDHSGRYLVIDYINDPIDLRLQSKAEQGVPDFIVNSIAKGLSEYVSTIKKMMAPYVTKD